MVPRKRGRGTRKQRDITCLVCGKRYRTLRADHLREHGLTRERYRRIYGARSVGSPDDRLGGSSDQSGDPHLDLVARLSARVADSAGFLDALASECAEHILSAAPLRAQVAFAAAQMIQARVAIHADAVGRLSRVTSELDAEWRITAGGHAGRPTPTKDLLGIAMQAHAEVVKAEEMVLKAARLALDERKVDADAPTAPGYTFSGAAETIAVPRDLSAADREGLRALMGNLQQYVKATRRAREVIDVAGASVPAEGDGTGTPPAAAEGPAADPLAMTATPISTRRRRRTA